MGAAALVTAGVTLFDALLESALQALNGINKLSSETFNKLDAIKIVLQK